ncbi:Werner Syndrome-like exonuclease [Quillaja saponaria]|uniref:Werner Syndrome-like exonuclease n=1 Tax=Quillaja saponaria TaxID=32244 RepID=A0AAD7LLQ9_QUISA|nr:Werner Syndrome-like exonuclease [Quillaja saponaria]
MVVMTTKIEELCTCERSRMRKLHGVTFHGHPTRVTVTSSCKIANSWIKSHLLAQCRYRETIVGLDIEWRPSFTRGVQNPVATVQLFIKRCCLIFQLYQALSIPTCLYEALEHPNITFTGVGIAGDAAKLQMDYGLEIENFGDIAEIAAEEFKMKKLRKAGLKTLVKALLREEMEKPKHVAVSNWEAKKLTCDPIQYACMDAYYSYILGKGLITGHEIARSPRTPLKHFNHKDHPKATSRPFISVTHAD